MNRGYRRNPSNPSSFFILDSNTIMEDHSTMIKTSKQLTLHFIRLQVVSSHIPSCTTFYEICKQNQKKKKKRVNHRSTCLVHRCLKSHILFRRVQDLQSFRSCSSRKVRKVLRDRISGFFRFHYRTFFT